MSRKSMIVFVLATTVAVAALVFDGISHRRSRNTDQPVAQNPTIQSAATQPEAAQPTTEAANSTDGQNDGQSSDAADATTAESGNGQDAATDGTTQQADSNGVAADASDSSADAAQQADSAQADAPQPIVVPAGTTLTVRLGEDLGSNISHVNQRFSATLDRDVVVQGQTVIAAGSHVTGKVVAVKPAGPLAGEANLQLRITSVRLDQGNLTLVTSTRSFGPTIKGKNKVGRFMKGLVKRASGQEKEVLLAEQSQYSFTLQKRLEIQ